MFWRFIYRITGFFKQRLQWIDDVLEVAGLARVRDIQRLLATMMTMIEQGGWRAIALGIVTLTVAGFAAIVLMPPGQRQSALESIPLQMFLAGAACYGFGVLAWSIEVFHPAVRLVASAFILWYFLLGPVLSLPRHLALLPAWVMFVIEVRRLHQRGDWYLWSFVWAILLSRLSWSIVQPSWLNFLLWITLYAFAGWVIRVLNQRITVEYNARLILTASMAFVYIAAWLEQRTILWETTKTSYLALADFLALFWMWLACDAIDDTARLAGHVVSWTRRFLVHPITLRILATSIGALGAAGLVIYGSGVPVLWQRGFVLCSVLFVVVSLATLFRISGARSLVDVAHDAVISSVTVIVVYGIGSQFNEELTSGSILEGSGWQVLLAGFPILLEEFKVVFLQQQRSWPLATAYGIVGIIITSIVYAYNREDIVRSTLEAPMYGLILWALPVVGLRVILGWELVIPVTRLFVLGYLSAYGAVTVAPDIASGSLGIVVLIWAVGYWLGIWRFPNSLPARVGVTFLVGCGALAFYHYPLVVPIPFIPWVSDLLVRIHAATAPELLSLPHIAILVAIAVVAYLIARWYLLPMVWIASAGLLALLCRVIAWMH